MLQELRSICLQPRTQGSAAAWAKITAVGGRPHSTYTRHSRAMSIALSAILLLCKIAVADISLYHSRHRISFLIVLLVCDLLNTPWVTLDSGLFVYVRRLVVGFAPWRPGFQTRSGHVGFVVDNVEIEHVSSQYFSFPYQSFQLLLPSQQNTTKLKRENFES
jgi:hypothetical protein